MVVSVVANVVAECPPGSWCANETEQEAYGDDFFHAACSWIGCEGDDVARSWRQNYGHAILLADQLKAQMYQYALKASTHMDVYGAKSSWLLAQGATRARTIIERAAPSVVVLTPQTDAGFFLAVVSAALISYLVFKLAQHVARVSIAVLR